MASIDTFRKGTRLGPEEVWIISDGRFTDMDLPRISGGTAPTSAVMYQISDLARYMLSPRPIEVKKTLVGCEVRFRKPFFSSVKEGISRRLPLKMRSADTDESTPTEVLMAPPKKSPPDLSDEALKAHFRRIEGLLSPFTPLARRLKAVDMKKVEDLVGICEDLTRERTFLKVEGSIQDKVDYIVRNISQDVGVILGSSYMAEDLFEMRGFDFTSYDPGRSHQLVRFVQDGKAKACVLGANQDVQFWVAEAKLIRYLRLLEQSIRRNAELREAFLKCANGDANPFRLFFNRKMGIDYSQANPPEIYREVFKSCQIGTEERHAVIRSLSSLQIGVSFSYIRRIPSGAPRLYTCLSVMHNVRALEPIKKELPQIYEEISKRASICEASRFYLLDSAAGYQNAQ